MYNNNIPQNNFKMQRPNKTSYNDTRMFGSFAVPFVLGGITGSLLTPRYYNYPIYYGQYPYYNPYPPYRPY